MIDSVKVGEQRASSSDGYSGLGRPANLRRAPQMHKKELDYIEPFSPEESYPQARTAILSHNTGLVVLSAVLTRVYTTARMCTHKSRKSWRALINHRLGSARALAAEHRLLRRAGSGGQLSLLRRHHRGCLLLHSGLLRRSGGRGGALGHLRQGLGSAPSGGHVRVQAAAIPVRRGCTTMRRE